jgi:TRAP-type C4-dicarboxylate transport system permease small subunit
MNPIRSLALVLAVLGIAALAYGGFTYTKETHKADIGSLAISVKDKETVNVPVWAGVAAIVVGVVLLVVPSRKIA